MIIGKHEAKPLSYQFGKSKVKGTEMVTIQFMFVGGPNDGKRIHWNGYFTDATAKRTLDSLEYCGWDGVSVARMDGFGSKNVELVVEEEEGQDGNSYPVVQWVNRLFARGPAQVYKEDELTSLEARLSALNAERRRENAEKAGVKASVPDPDPFNNG